VKEDEESVIIINVGANDSQYLLNENLFRIPIEKFQENVKKIIETAMKFTNKVIFIGIPPMDERKTTPIVWDANKIFKNEYLRRYDDAAKSMCVQNNIHFVELFYILNRAGYLRTLHDGVHPNQIGHAMIFKIVKDYLFRNKIV
jgi:lysophospholipase L1-like esterase